MRRADGLSSLRSSRRARSVYSIVQAKIQSHFLRTERAFLALAHTLDHIGCEIVVLQFVEMGQDHLANVERLGAPGLFGQGVETAFNFFGKADGSGHRILVFLVFSVSQKSPDGDRMITFAAYCGR